MLTGNPCLIIVRWLRHAGKTHSLSQDSADVALSLPSFCGVTPPWQKRKRLIARCSLDGDLPAHKDETYPIYRTGGVKSVAYFQAELRMVASTSVFLGWVTAQPSTSYSY